MDSHSINIDISTTEPFEKGTTLGFHTFFGNEYDNKISALPEGYKTADITVGVKLVLNNAEHALEAVTMLNGLKEQYSAFPPVQEALDKGVAIDFRQEDSNVHLDMHLSGEFAAAMRDNDLFKNANVTGLDFDHKVSLDISTAFDPVSVFSKSPDELLMSAFNWSIIGTGNSQKMTNLIDNICAYFESKEMTDDRKNLMNFMTMCKFFIAVQKVAFIFKYVPSLVKDLVSGLSNNNDLTTVTGAQGMAQQMLPTAQLMAPMFLGPYMHVLKSVQFAEWEAHIFIPKIRLYANVTLSVPNLNTFVHENFLQD
jgi:hypothetical protein